MVAEYAHPILGAVAAVMLFIVAVPPLRERTRRRASPEVRARHAARAPIAYALISATWATGLLSTWLWRSDLDPAASLHFRGGTILLLLLLGSRATARAMQQGRDSGRELHPWFGAAVLLLAAFQVASGLQLLR